MEGETEEKRISLRSALKKKNHRVKKRSGTAVTAESSRGTKQILSVLIVLRETALSCNWKSDASFELRCMRRPWECF